MLDALKKAAGFKAAEPSAEMESLKAEFAGYKETAEALAAQMEEQLDVAKKSAAEMAEKLAQAEEKLAAFEAEAKASAEAQALAAEKAKAEKMEARKASLAVAVGDEQAAQMFDALVSLDDSKFEAVVSALAVGIDREAESAAFKEVGVEAQVVVEQEKALDFRKFIKRA